MVFMVAGMQDMLSSCIPWARNPGIESPFQALMTRFPKSTCITTWWLEWSTGSHRTNCGSISTWSTSRLSVFGKESFWRNLVLSRSKTVYRRELAMTWCGCLVPVIARRCWRLWIISSVTSQNSCCRQRSCASEWTVKSFPLSSISASHPRIPKKSCAFWNSAAMTGFFFESPPQRR